MQADRRIGGSGLARQLGDWRPSGGVRLSSALAERIRLLVLDGRLGLHTRLPAERELADTLRLSRASVSAAYEQLRSAGYLRSRQGAGSWTTLPIPAGSAADVSPWSLNGDTSGHDLAHASLFAPSDELRAATQRAVDLLPCFFREHGYHLLGLPGLRSAIADRFTERGLPTSPDQVIVTAGAQHALTLAITLLVGPGDRVLVEHPTYPNALDAVRRRGARPVPVGFTATGWDLELLTGTVRDAAPRLGYLIPDFHNPTGYCMDGERRSQVIALAQRTGTPLVIDETLTETALDGAPPTPMAAHGGAGSAPVITIGSASKIFWGGLRIGWLRTPATLVRRIASIRASVDMACPVLEQLIVADLLPRVAEIQPRRLAALRDNREALGRLLATQLPGWRPNRPSGGLSLWADLGEPASSRLVGAAARHGVLLVAGPRFGLDGAFERYLRLPFTLPPTELSHAISKLAAAWTSVQSGMFTEAGPTAVA